MHNPDIEPIGTFASEDFSRLRKPPTISTEIIIPFTEEHARLLQRKQEKARPPKPERFSKLTQWRHGQNGTKKQALIKLAAVAGVVAICAVVPILLQQIH